MGTDSGWPVVFFTAKQLELQCLMSTYCTCSVVNTRIEDLYPEIKGLAWADQRNFECYIRRNPTECFMGYPLIKFHTALYSTISPCNTKSYISSSIKHSTTKDAHSYKQASRKRKATPIILLVNVIRIVHENR